ncbi:MAG: thioesterase family protein [Aeriscardovia sp.]|nr:thioesterase family protein [Aeriscardovia sp.]MBR3359561.1 thioesterase family protein [Aeriscardovia sp.]
MAEQSKENLPSLHMNAGAANISNFASSLSLAGKAMRENLYEALDLVTDHDTPDQMMLHGKTLYFPTGRTYGGHIMAQSIVAGAMSLPQDGRIPHSAHGYFITPGRLGEDIHFEVNKIRDGRSFSQRSVLLSQGAHSLLRMMASYQVNGQEGIDFSTPMPENVPDPESLPSSIDLMQSYADKSAFAHYYAKVSSFDIRHVSDPVFITYDDSGVTALPDGQLQGQAKARPADKPQQMVWMRLLPEGIGSYPLTIDDQIHQRALLAMGCDQIMTEPALRQSGLSLTTPGITIATLDHSMWWYADIDVTKWHLYVQNAPVAGHGRVYCRARVYQGGRLRAEITQEALLRVPKSVQPHQHAD